MNFSNKSQGKAYLDGKRKLEFVPKKGNIMDLCASLDERYICCRTHVIKTVSNCPFECTYCFLQNYLTNATMSVVDDIDAIIEEVKARLNSEPERFFRIGNWELGDSLALEGVCGQARKLIEAFADIKGAILDLRTKSANVENILSARHNGRTIVSWTLSPPKVITEEELKTASLAERLRAIKKIIAAGYLTAFHFDPMIYYPGWEKDYEDLVKQCFEAAPPERVCWVSIGSLRFNPEMKKTLEINFPDSKITAQEMITGDDNKMRYVKPIRQQMYAHLIKYLKKYGSDEVFIYLCMERWNMWERIFGRSPASPEHLDSLITKSLLKRFF